MTSRTLIAATFVSSGLAAGDRVLYVASDRPAATVRTALETHQVPAGPASAAGQRLTRAPAQLRRIIDLAGFGHPGVVID